MAIFLITPHNEYEYSKTMDIVRQKSLTYNTSNCSIEIVGSWTDYRHFEKMMENQELKIELDKISSENDY